MKKNYTVFVSSPGDVDCERELAAEVFKRLNLRFKGRLEIEPFFWEDSNLLFHTDPQSQTRLTSQYDVVICILWSRLGSMLNPERFLKPDGTQYDSGTEFELDTAIKAFEETKTKPLIYLFQRPGERGLTDKDPKSATAHEDRMKLDRYLKRVLGEEWLAHSANTYTDPSDFERKLEKTLHDLFVRVVGEEQYGPGRHLTDRPRVNPFKGLQVFDYADAEFYHGRRAATLGVIEHLKAQARKDCAFVMIFGSSGLGKSSLVRAGVLPWLREPATVRGVCSWRQATLIPSQAKDWDGDLFRLLAAALLHAGPSTTAPDAQTPPVSRHREPLRAVALPQILSLHTAEGVAVDAALLADKLRTKPDQARGYIEQTLIKLERRYVGDDPEAPPAVARLALFIDQFEEIFRHTRREDCEAFLRTLQVLASGGWIWILATTRSDFFAECEKWPVLHALKAESGTYHLAPPTPDELSEMIRRPADVVDLWFERDYAADRRLDDILIRAAHGNPHALPLLEFTLDQLFKRSDPKTGLLRLQTYDALGGVEGALAVHATASLRQAFGLPPEDVTFDQLKDDPRKPEEIYGVEAARCFGAVMRQLVSIGTSETEPPVRRLAPKAVLDREPAHAHLAGQLINDRLLVVTADEKEGHDQFVSVAHEALLSCWPLLKRWIADYRQNIKIRDRLDLDAKAWDVGHRNPIRLYSDELRLTEASRVLREGFLDGEIEKEFVEASIAGADERRFAGELRSDADSRVLSSLRIASEEGRARVLLEALRDASSRQARSNAAAVLGREPIGPLLDELVRLAVEDPENRVRRVAAESLVRLGNEEVLDSFFGRLQEPGWNFAVVGGIARVQIAAESSERRVDLGRWLVGVSRIARFRLWLRRRAVRFLRAFPAFLLILIPQFVLAAAAAGTVKMLTGTVSWAICQADPSIGMGLFHGLVAAFSWGSFITFAISLHHFVFSKRRDRTPPTLRVPVPAFFRPVGSLLFGGVFGFMGSLLIVLLIAAVFSGEALYTMGWNFDNLSKSEPGYFWALVQELTQGFLWPYLFTGTCLGIGMAMMGNGLQTSSEWIDFRASQQRLVEWKQVVRLVLGMTRRAFFYAWPIPLLLCIGWIMAFSVLERVYHEHGFPTPAAWGWEEKLGWRVGIDEAKLDKMTRDAQRTAKGEDELRRMILAAKVSVRKDGLRNWKQSAWGQGLGIAGDELAQGLGGFFCIVGMGLGFVALTKGINIEPTKD